MEKFDFVIVGGGHNGLTMAAYLAKSGYSVAVAEARLEIGGGMDFVEPIPGYVMQPHAVLWCARAAPGVDQLELWRHGLRLSPFESIFLNITSDDRPLVVPAAGSFFYPATGDVAEGLETLSEWSTKDVATWTNLWGAIGGHLNTIYRSLLYVPPWPIELEYDAEDTPWYQLAHKRWPEVFGPEWLSGSLVDVLDPMFECEPFKAVLCYTAFGCGAAPAHRSQALPSFVTTIIQGSQSPIGGMHMYAHALARVGMHHGAKYLTNCPVEEIIVRDNRAVGVRLRDDADYKEKILMANKAVISGVDVWQTFGSLVGSDHQDKSFKQRVADIDLQGGQIYYDHIACSDYPRLKGKAGELVKKLGIPPMGYMFPVDGMQDWYNLETACRTREVPKNIPGHNIIGCINSIAYDTTLAPEGHTVLSPFQSWCAAPEVQTGGPEALDSQKDAMQKEYLELLYNVSPEMRDKVIGSWANSPLEQGWRNPGFAGGSWYGPSARVEQWWSGRPLPELSRYRTPIDNLYLCHQSCYPGGLCLMAVAYNCMHILIDDGLVEPKSWWYPSPWHVKDGEKRVPQLEDLKL